MFLLAVSRRQKQRYANNRSGWSLRFWKSSKPRNHIRISVVLSLLPWFPFFSISSSVFLPSLFHSSTFICSFHRLYFFFAYLLCYKHNDILTPPCHFPLMLSHFLSLVLYLSFYSSVCPALSRYLCSAEAGKWRSLRLRRCSSPVSPVPPCTNLRELKY